MSEEELTLKEKATAIVAAVIVAPILYALLVIVLSFGQ